MGCGTSNSKRAGFKSRLMNRPDCQILKPEIERLKVVEDA